MKKKRSDPTDKSLPQNLDAERFVLGSILLDDSQYATVTGALSREAFALNKHGLIWDRMTEMAGRGEKIDRVTLANEFLKRGELESVDGLTYITSLDDGLPQISNLNAYVAIIVECWRKRKAIFAAQKILTQAYSGEFTADEIAQDGQALLAEQVGGYGSSQIESVRDYVTTYPGGVNRFLSPSLADKGIPTGLLKFDEATDGFHETEIFLVGARPSHGKAQPYDAKILMESGAWKSMGDLQVGDRLASVDGMPSYVERVFEQGVKPVFRITFRDGRSTECCDEHLWRLHHRQWKSERVFSTEILRGLLKAKRNENRLSIPVFSGVYGQRRELPVHPWLLGVLIGDGDTSGSCPRITTKDTEIRDLAASLLFPEYSLSPSTQTNRCPAYRIIRSGGCNISGIQGSKRNGINDSLQVLGISGLRSWEKYIPDIYLTADYEQRMDLLRGLMDTDGTVGKTGEISYCTTSKKLRDQFQYLVRSVGGICDWTERSPSYKDQFGIKRSGRKAYVLNVIHRNPGSFFTLSRKIQRTITSSRKQRLYVTGVSPSGSKQCRCIKVSHKSSLYITDDHIVTHNTAFASCVAKNVARTGVGVAVFTMELSKQMWLHRMICEEAFVSYFQFRKGDLNEEERRRVRIATEAVMDMPIYIDDSSGLSMADVQVKMNRIMDKYEVGLTVMDYAQLIRPPKGMRFGTENDKFTAIGEEIKVFTKKTKKPLLLLSQLNRDSEKDKGENIPKLSQCRGAGIWEEISFVGSCLYREWLRKRERDDLREVASLLVEKNRSGPALRIDLRFIPRLMRFGNIDPDLPPS